jgi:hypothetical protein
MKFASIVLLGVLFAAPAMAQQVGEYDGTMADGSSVAIVVAKDPNNSNLEVTTISFHVTDDCRQTKETLSFGGVGLNDGNDIAANGKFSYVSSDFFEIDLVTSMTFKGKSVSGKGAVNLAAYNPAEGHETLTNKTQACVSPSQSFSARFTGTDTPSRLPAGVVIANPKN